MKLKVDVREKRLIKLLEAYVIQFNFKKIDIEIETLKTNFFTKCSKQRCFIWCQFVVHLRVCCKYMY